MPENRPNSRVSFNTESFSRASNVHSPGDVFESDYVIHTHGHGENHNHNISSRDNLKLFPSRNNAYIMTRSSSPISTSSRGQLQNGGVPRDTLEKPLLINNGNISSTNGRNGVALNQLNQNGVSPAANAANGTNNRNGKTHYQRLRPVGIRHKVWRDCFKVIALICGSFAAILLVMGLASSEWLLADRYRQGLFVYCVEKNVSIVPFVQPQDKEGSKEGCHRIDWNVQGYTLVAAAFCGASFLVCVFTTGLTALGLRSRDPARKYKYYRVSTYFMSLALVAVLVALVVYPVCFAQIMEKSNRPVWEFGWAYGVAWGASIFLFGGVILLLCDKESEEIYYKERTIVYADTNNKV